MTPRQREVQGPAGPISQRRSAALLSVCLLLAACSGSSPAGDPTTTSASPTTSTSLAPETTSTTVPSPGVEDELLAAWDGLWQAWAAVRASEDLDPAPLEQVAAPRVVEGVLVLFERQRESGLGPVGTEVVTHAKVTDAESGEAVIEDCVLLSPSFTDTVGVWYRAQLVLEDRGWAVSDLRIANAGGCVPAEIAAAAIEGYEDYYDAQSEFWDPADPAHPLVDEVLTEPQRSFIVDILEEHRTRGVALRGRPSTHPEVIELRSPTELVILDCFEPAPDFGLYDLETGERLPDEPPVREGQRNLRSAVMVFEEGRWKVADLQGQVDFACEFAPTRRGLPSV